MLHFSHVMVYAVYTFLHFGRYRVTDACFIEGEVAHLFYQDRRDCLGVCASQHVRV